MTVDMTAEAVTQRLKLVSQLHRLCLALGEARPAPSEPGTRPTAENPVVKNEMDNSAPGPLSNK